MIFFTEIQHLPFYGAKGEFLGKVEDLLVDPTTKGARVAAYMIRTPHHDMLSVPYTQLQSITVRAGQTNVSRSDLKPYVPDETLIRINHDVLDQQIIDVDNRKVVRVNDLDFDIEPVDGHSELRIVAVNVGLAAAVRRLLQGVVSKHRIRIVTKTMSTRTILWEFVNLIESDPARRVKLRISFDKLADLHPADIADILENLSYNEQKAVIEALDDETAASALSEIPTKMQADLLVAIDPEKAADIVEEMPPDEAADVLAEMPPESSAEVLADMGKEEAQEVRELLGFDENTAGSVMTTEYVFVHESAQVEGAIEALKNFEGDVESVHQIFLIDDKAMLKGDVAVSRILLAPANAPLSSLAGEEVRSVQSDQSVRSVIDLFHKYNLVALPVVDDENHLVGMVTADDVLELVINRR